MILPWLTKEWENYLLLLEFIQPPHISLWVCLHILTGIRLGSCFCIILTACVYYTVHLVLQLDRSVTQWCPNLRPHGLQHAMSLSITNSKSLLNLMSIESVMPSNHLILCHPLILLPSIFPSIKIFSNESVLRIRWPKYWSFTFSISLSNEYSELISFRTDWFDLLAVQNSQESSPKIR